MERPKWIESQIEMIVEMVKSRDMQFHNLHMEMVKNRREINKLEIAITELIKSIKGGE